jgi:hypothetical protein
MHLSVAGPAKAIRHALDFLAVIGDRKNLPGGQVFFGLDASDSLATFNDNEMTVLLGIFTDAHAPGLRRVHMSAAS